MYLDMMDLVSYLHIFGYDGVSCMFLDMMGLVS